MLRCAFLRMLYPLVHWRRLLNGRFAFTYQGQSRERTSRERTNGALSAVAIAAKSYGRHHGHRFEISIASGEKEDSIHSATEQRVWCSHQRNAPCFSPAVVS